MLSLLNMREPYPVQWSIESENGNMKSNLFLLYEIEFNIRSLSSSYFRKKIASVGTCTKSFKVRKSYTFQKDSQKWAG